MPTYLETIESRVELFYSSLLSGRAEKAKDCVTADFTLEEAPELPYTQAEYTGLEEVAKLIEELNSLIQMMKAPEIKVHVCSASQAFVVITAPSKVRKTGVEFELEVVEMLNIVDGRIAHIKPYYFRQQPFLDLVKNDGLKAGISS